MPKVFDCEEEPNDFMEMPCQCDCGKWFDLHDGYPSNSSNKVVCRECKEAQDDDESEDPDDLNFPEEERDELFNDKK